MTPCRYVLRDFRSSSLIDFSCRMFAALWLCPKLRLRRLQKSRVSRQSHGQNRRPRSVNDWAPFLPGWCIFNGGGPWYQVLPRGSPITWGETKNLPVCWWSFVALKPQRSIWLMLTNEVPESTIAAVLQNIFFRIWTRENHKKTHWTLLETFFDQISIMALIIMDGKSHSEINVIEFREPFTSPGCSSRLAGQTPVPGSSRVHLVKFTQNIPQWVPFNDSFCIILPMALLLERWIVTMSRVTSRELIILYYSFVASHLHVTCSCFSLWMMIVGQNIPLVMPW